MGSCEDVIQFQQRWSAGNGAVADNSFDASANGLAYDTANDCSADPRPCDRSSRGVLAVSCACAAACTTARTAARIAACTEPAPLLTSQIAQSAARHVTGIQLLITRSLLQHTTIDPVGFFVRVSIGRREYAVAQVLGRDSERLVMRNSSLHTCTVRCELVSNTMFSPEELAQLECMVAGAQFDVSLSSLLRMLHEKERSLH